MSEMVYQCSNRYLLWKMCSILDEKERLKLEMEESKIAIDLMTYIMQNPEMFEKVKEMIKFVEKVRENPELMEMLIQLKDVK